MSFYKADTVVHALIMHSIIGIDNSSALTPDLQEYAKEYLNHAYKNDEWAKVRVMHLVAQGEQTITQLVREHYPKLLNEKRKVRPDFIAPDNIVYDVNLVNSLKEKIIAYKKAESEKEMENDQVVKAVPTTVDVDHLAGVDLTNLTLDNYKDMTGQRFRMTREQVARAKAGSLTREAAFAEYLEAAKAARGAGGAQ